MSRAATAFFDGGVRANHYVEGKYVGHHACSAVLYIEGEPAVERALYLGPDGSGNQAETRGLILALESAAEAQVTHLRIRSDSRLVVEQALGNWRIKDAELRALHATARERASVFQLVEIDHIKREHNEHADALCTEILDRISGRKRSQRFAGRAAATK